MIIKSGKVEARISSGSHDYGEYYLGSVRFYEVFSPTDVIPSTNPIYKRHLYTIRTDIKRLTAQDAQQDAVQLAHDILATNNIPYLEV